MKSYFPFFFGFLDLPLEALEEVVEGRDRGTSFED